MHLPFTLREYSFGPLSRSLTHRVSFSPSLSLSLSRSHMSRCRRSARQSAATGVANSLLATSAPLGRFRAPAGGIRQYAPRCLAGKLYVVSVGFLYLISVVYESTSRHLFRAILRARSQVLLSLSLLSSFAPNGVESATIVTTDGFSSRRRLVHVCPTRERRDRPRDRSEERAERQLAGDPEDPEDNR